jgi:hypothetical protein
VCIHSSAEGELTVLSSGSGVYTAACIVILCIETIILFTPAFFHNLTTVCKEMNNCIYHMFLSAFSFRCDSHET